MNMTRVATFIACLVGLSATGLACDCPVTVTDRAAAVRLVADATAVAGSQVALEIGGITCDSCAQIVHMALTGVVGVQAVELRATQDPTVLIAVVSCDANVVAEALAAATDDLGYPTVIVDDES